MSSNGKPIPELTEKELHRFWSKADVRGEDGPWCWYWTRFRAGNGYGRITIRRTAYFSHRVAFTLTHGAIPPGLVIDHLCRNRACVNPAHLEAVTPGTNTRRGDNRESQKTECPSGHPYDSENTAYHPNGWRRCKQCNRDSVRAWKAARRAEA